MVGGRADRDLKWLQISAFLAARGALLERGFIPVWLECSILDSFAVRKKTRGDKMG